MNVILISLTFLATAVVVSAGEKGPDDCVCVSANFGCEAIRSKKKMVQMGWCNKRCCTDSSDGSKRDCKCTHGNSCPDDMPEESGNCAHLVYCCPEKSKRKMEL